MHIVQALVSLNIGGSELVATELAESLVSRGHKVTIIAADGPLGPRARACGAEHLDWPIGKKRLATLRYIRRLSDWIAVEKPDILHVHSRLPAWICWRAINRLAPELRPAFVTTMHGHYSVSRYSSVMARGNKTIAVSEHIRRYTMKNYPSARADDIITIHGGASRELFPYAYQHPPEWREAAEKEFPELAGKRWLLLISIRRSGGKRQKRNFRSWLESAGCFYPAGLRAGKGMSISCTWSPRLSKITRISRDCLSVAAEPAHATSWSWKHWQKKPV
jgi:glycosyltransferase involved in cell wall biosynthesis